MKAKPESLMVFALVFVVVILGILSCGREDSEKEMLRDQVKTAEARLDEVRERLIREQERTQDEMATVQRSLNAERERVNTEIRQLKLKQETERQATEVAKDDFVIAAVIAFSCILGMLLLIGLLLHERRSRKALGLFLRWIQGRSNGKTG